MLKQNLACIFSPCARPCTDHIDCDVSIERHTAVTLCSGDDGESDGAEGEGDLTSAVTGGAPPRHPAHPARQRPSVLFGEWGEGHVLVLLDG